MIGAIPESLGKEQMLDTIDATGNRFETFPSDLRRFRTLETLLLSRNAVSSLPKSFDQLAGLKTLHVRHNQLTSFVLPKAVADLDVSDNPLHLPLDDPRGSLLVRMGEESHVLNLTELSLSSLKLTEIPLALCNLRLLVGLDLSHNELGTMPDKFYWLRNLRRLDLSHNVITSAKKMNSFRKLEQLNISNNALTVFPIELTTLKYLVRLDMSSNKINSLPDHFGKLNRLVNLNLSSNEILTFPNDHIDVLASLLVLDVSQNYIDRFPLHFPYLYRLHVVRAGTNDIDELPRDIGLKMKALEKLDLSDNFLTALPESLAKCPLLKEVNVSHNKIMTFPNSFETLRQKAEVSYDEQSAYKDREPHDRTVFVPPPAQEPTKSAEEEQAEATSDEALLASIDTDRTDAHGTSPKTSGRKGTGRKDAKKSLKSPTGNLSATRDPVVEEERKEGPEGALETGQTTASRRGSVASIKAGSDATLTVDGHTNIVQGMSAVQLTVAS